MEILTNVKDILQMARDERCSGYTAELLVKDLNELIALRKAGEKMRSLVEEFLSADKNTMLGLMVIDALAEWEAANK